MTGIVTYHNAINEGAMLQAACLSAMVQLSGHTPAVIDYRSPHREAVYADHPGRDVLLAFMKSALPLSPLTFTDPLHAAWWINRNCTACLVGSDEVWKWDEPGYSDPVPSLYWGHGIEVRKAAYAVCVGDCNPARAPREAADLIGSFDLVSVRDAATETLARKAVAPEWLSDPTLGIDPLSLFPDAEAEARDRLAAVPGPHLFLTTPDLRPRTEGWHGTVVTTAADSLGPLAPPVWAAVHKLAARVVTARFRSTVLAMRYGTELVCDARRPKVKDILGRLGANPDQAPIAWPVHREEYVAAQEGHHAAFLRAALG